MLEGDGHQASLDLCISTGLVPVFFFVLCRSFVRLFVCLVLLFVSLALVVCLLVNLLVLLFVANPHARAPDSAGCDLYSRPYSAACVQQ